MPAGGAEEWAAWSERRFAAAFLPSIPGAPVEAGVGSAVLGAFAAPRSCGVPFPELVAVMAAPSLVWGLRWPSPRCLALLLLKIRGSLQVGSSPSSLVVDGVVEEGWIRRRLEADTPPKLRFWCLRQMAFAASQLGCSRRLLRREVSSSSSFPEACCWCLEGELCLVDPRSACVGCFFLLFVCVCAIFG